MTALLDPSIIDDYARRYSNWGRWGSSDQAGTTNLITSSAVRGAARAVRHGQVVSLSLPFGPDGPQTGANGRFNCLRYSVASGTDHALGRQRWAGGVLPTEMGYADDTVVLHLQCSTHWDSLCHIFHRGKMYNGYPAAQFTSAGAERNGLEQLTGRLVGRAVLLDIPRAKGVEWLDDGYAITAEDLDEALELARLTVDPGDIVLVRTGKLARSRREGWGTFAGGDAPGLSFFTIPWLYEKQVGAVASDTWGVEVRPNELRESYQPFHLPALVYMGLPLGEGAEDGKYDMLHNASPVPFVGSAGGPPGPTAIR
jgi:kynurenine formamidase